MKELYNDVPSEWNPIGTFLEISDGELKAISQNEHGDPKKCLIAMLKVWLHQTNPPASWINSVVRTHCMISKDLSHRADSLTSYLELPFQIWLHVGIYLQLCLACMTVLDCPRPSTL